jgi:hypothetical protein
MNKLEELHFSHSKIWDCYNDEPLEENHALKSAEITTDVAVKFGQFCIDLPKHHKEILRNNPDITTQELFGYFINNYYEKRS